MLISLLRCPLCEGYPPLQLDAKGTSLYCSGNHPPFPFTDGFPDLRPDNLKTPAPAATLSPGN